MPSDPLRNAIARELTAQCALRSNELAFAELADVAYAVAASLRQEFRIERLPQVFRDLPDCPDR
jgi:hypothetical protein